MPKVPDAEEEVRALKTRSTRLREELQVILGEDVSAEYARWVEPKDMGLFIHASPVEVGGMMRSMVYEKTPSVVFTSATLSSNGNFDYFESRMGLDCDPKPTEVILDSPFDYASQSLLFIPHATPPPNSREFVEEVTPIVKELLTKTRGRAFLLCTSIRNMKKLFENIAGQVPFPLLIQGSKPKSRLLEDFRATTGSVLFATSSFWEGVDVQGEALSCVVVDKLPFAPPDEPVVSARIEKLKRNGEDPFFKFQVPMAVLALKQGLGRLIRTRSDRGVLCVLDNRIVTKSYGKIFLKSLFKSPVCRTMDRIDSFFDGGSSEKARTDGG